MPAAHSFGDASGFGERTEKAALAIRGPAVVAGAQQDRDVGFERVVGSVGGGVIVFHGRLLWLEESDHLT